MKLVIMHFCPSFCYSFYHSSVCPYQALNLCSSITAGYKYMVFNNEVTNQVLSQCVIRDTIRIHDGVKI